MKIEFHVLPKNNKVPTSGKNVVYLNIDLWNDYSFMTTFYLSVHDEQGQYHNIGSIKIGFKGQMINVPTFKKLDTKFENLDEKFFSLGQGIDFYQNIASFPTHFKNSILYSLNDIVFQPKLIDKIKDEKVFGISLLRGYSLSVVKNQFARILEERALLTDYKFRFKRPDSRSLHGIDLDFDVKANSTPSTNIHAVIGRNGVGKTTLLNEMIEAITDKQSSATFVDIENDESMEKKIPDYYFSRLVSVSFSAFDPFAPPKNQPNPAKGTCYFYIGLKDPHNKECHKTINDIYSNCAECLINCFNYQEKTKRWLNAIGNLDSDEIFASMNLKDLEGIYKRVKNDFCPDIQTDSKEFHDKYFQKIKPLLSHMSSGHAIVLLIITSLVSTVEERTLVLLDEPESHLHPPLLSAFIRVLADLLHDQNGVAIIATHSPVVLQEIPKACVLKLFRIGNEVTCDRPKIETFGENVGLLTYEVFGLEVEHSGFHNLLATSVKNGETYDQILEKYGNQLGFEGKAILKVLVFDHNRKSSYDTIE